MEGVLNVAFVIAGLAMLCYGGNWLVDGGVAIAKRFRISPLIIGMTVIAYGTSTPELAASLAAGTHGAIVLGNVVGSNIANIGMVVGIAAILVPLAVNRSEIRTLVPIMVGFSVLLVALSYDGHLDTYDGLVLVGLLFAFTAYMYKKTRTKDGTEARVKHRMRASSVAKLAAGMILLYVGATLAVDNLVDIAEIAGVSEKIIGLTVLAVGTSLPELITSITAIRRGETNIGIGNIIGSNVYNILMIAGIASIVSGIAVPESIHLDYAVMTAFALAMLIALRGRIGVIPGMVLAAAYAAYLAFLVLF